MSFPNAEKTRRRKDEDLATLHPGCVPDTGAAVWCLHCFTFDDLKGKLFTQKLLPAVARSVTVTEYTVC